MNTVRKKQNRGMYGLRSAFALIAFLFLTTFALAQSNTSAGNGNSNNVEAKNGILKNWFFGINGGGTFMLSSLHDKPYSWAVGAVLGKQFNRKVGIRADYLYGQMYSEGLYNGLTLANYVNFMDASIIIKLSLNDFIFTKSPKFLREFYMFGGGGVTLFNSRVFDIGSSSYINVVGWDALGTTKTTMEMTPFVPIGAGAAFNILKSGRIFLTAEFSYRYSQDNLLDAGLTTKAANYTYTSLGIVYNIGKPTFTPQQITADEIEKRVKSTVAKEVSAEMTAKMNAKIDSEITPMKEELAKTTKALSDNKETVLALQEEVESRINALNESLKEGMVTTEMPDGTVQRTPVSQMSAGAIPTLTSVYFAFNSLYITSDMQREIATIAKIMKKNKGLKCEIVGNASNVGSPEYNLMLSQKRAEAVALLLAEEFGISENRLRVKSNGLADPLAKNLNKINRRVDLQLIW